MRTFDPPRYTYSDYKNWKEDWELIQGYPYQFLPSAVASHNKVQLKMAFQAENSLLKNDENCNCALFTELDWKVSEETVVRPDLMIICGKEVIDFLEFPPVLILEILSPSTQKKDRTLKFELYQEQGVKYYLLADYIKKTVEVYELIDNRYKEVERNIFLVDKKCEVVFDYEKVWK